LPTAIHNSTGLLPDPVDKIAKLIRLMASTIDGECLNAVRALGGVLESAGVDFHYLSAAVAEGWRDPVTTVLQLRPRPRWQTFASELLTHPHYLLENEFNFLHNMERAPYEPTARQWKWLGDIQARIPQREAKQ
jgi:hypothetical protein